MSNYYVHWYLSNAKKKSNAATFKGVSDAKFYESQAAKIENFRTESLAKIYKNLD